jgi:hypothetical protein
MRTRKQIESDIKRSHFVVLFAGIESKEGRAAAIKCGLSLLEVFETGRADHLRPVCRRTGIER